MTNYDYNILYVLMTVNIIGILFTNINYYISNILYYIQYITNINYYISII